MSCVPSFSETLPAKRARPFSGVFLYVFISLRILSKESITDERVCFDFMLDAVDFSASSCFVTAWMLKPADQEIIKEKKILERYFNTLGKDPDKAVYGETKVNLALDRGAAEILLISKKVDKKHIAELEKKALNISASVVIISMETEEGIQFYNITKGVGAILRFALE